MFSFFPSRSTICNNNNTKCRTTTRKNPEKFFFSARENLHICYHLKTRRNDEVNAAADAKRDEAEEINIFIALPGGTNASTKFKVVTVCPMQQQKAAQYRPPLVLQQQ